MDSMPTLYTNTKIWVRDPDDVWRKDEIVEILPNYKILTGGNLILDSEDIHYYEEQDPLNCNDLTQLIHLHEPSVLESLSFRFQHDLIYTYTGPILLAVNPFKNIPNLYSNKTINSYMMSKDENTISKNSPHIFSVASLAFTALCETQKPQTILISGESGAGKTESTRFLMKFLADAGSVSSTSDSKSYIEYQVLQSNPLLESFGNAKTLRNENSSRFGKFTEMQFLNKNGKYKLSGARIHTYLLESVRVCHQNDRERNYHIFYQLCAASMKSQCQLYRFPQLNSKNVNSCTYELSMIKPISYYHYLNQSSCYFLKDVDDHEMFEATVTAMQAIGMYESEQQNLFNLLAAILYLGNINFVGFEEGSELDINSKDDFNEAARLLGVEPLSLLEALTYRSINTKHENLKVPIKVERALSNRDSLAKVLYETAFSMIVYKANDSIGFEDNVSTFCGILDIFGFECFPINTFEQLCINYTNEKLQHYFNKYIFICEDALYRQEEIRNWDPLQFPDNRACLIALEDKPFGLFAMLEEESLVPKGSDQGFCNKLRKQFSDDIIQFSKLDSKCFIINHFAGSVKYNSEMFLQKNKDQLHEDAQNCILNSSSEYVSNLFRTYYKRGQYSESKKRIITITCEFQNQLKALMDSIESTTPHFVRCIKPNQSSVPKVYERKFVADQLRYNGVIQSIKINRSGFPIRFSHSEAYDRFKMFVPNPSDIDDKSIKEKLKAVLQHIQEACPSIRPETWEVGKTILFLKQNTYNHILAYINQLKRSAAVKIQSKFKSYKRRQMYCAFRRSAIIIQSAYRGMKARRLFYKMKLLKSVDCISNAVAYCVHRNKYLRDYEKVVKIQRWVRRYQKQNRQKRQKMESAAKKIQMHWRCCLTRKEYKKIKRATLSIQTKWRQFLAKRKVNALKIERNDKIMLQLEIERLKQDLQTMKQQLQKSEEDRKLYVSGDLESVSGAIKSLITEPTNSDVSLFKTPPPLSPMSNHVENNSFEKDLNPRSSNFKKMKRKFSLITGNRKSSISVKTLAVPETSEEIIDILIIGENHSIQVLFENDLKQNRRILLTETHLSYRPIALFEHKKLHIIIGIYPITNYSYSEDLQNWTACSKSLLFYLHDAIQDKKLIESVVYSTRHHEVRYIYKLTSFMNDANRVFCNQLEQSSDSLYVLADRPPIAIYIHITQILEDKRKYSISSTDGSRSSNATDNTNNNNRMSYFWGRIQNILNVTNKSEARQPILIPCIRKRCKKKPMRIRFLNQQLTGATVMAFGISPLQNKNHHYLAVGNFSGVIHVYEIIEQLDKSHNKRLSESNRSSINYRDKIYGANYTCPNSPVSSTVNSYPLMYDDKGSISSHTFETFNNMEDFNSTQEEQLLYEIPMMLNEKRKISHITFNIKNHYMIYVLKNQEIVIWDLIERKIYHQIKTDEDILCIQFMHYRPNIYIYSTANQKLWTAHVHNPHVHFIDLPNASCNHFAFSDTGSHCFLGLSNGSILIIKILNNFEYQRSLSLNISQASITTIYYINLNETNDARLFVTTSDKRLHVIHCLYDQVTKGIIQLNPTINYQITDYLTPSRCLLSKASNGTFIFAPRDAGISALNIVNDKLCPIAIKKPHKHLVSLALNKASTLLATADANGGISVWRAYANS